jgi:hypothetical protein
LDIFSIGNSELRYGTSIAGGQSIVQSLSSYQFLSWSDGNIAWQNLNFHITDAFVCVCVCGCVRGYVTDEEQRSFTLEDKNYYMSYRPYLLVYY